MKDRSPYKNFSKEELILRDHLAIDRTILSNESAFLAYIRTSLAVIAAGATLVHFFTELIIQITGGVIVFAGATIILLGYRRYKKMDHLIKQVKRD